MKKNRFIAALFIVLSILFIVSPPGGNKATDVFAVYYSPDGVDVVITYPPLTERQKITWWRHVRADLIHRLMQAGHRHIPERWYVWDYGDGFKPAGKEDLICFDAIPLPANCLDKNIVMWISPGEKGATRYTFEHGVINDPPEGNVKMQSGTSQ